MGFLFYVSSIPTEIEVPSFSAFDKLTHLVAYGVLACLIYLALYETNSLKGYVLVVAFAISFFYGTLNEIHQYFLPWREADVFDAIANGMGALLFPVALRLKIQNRNR